MRTFYYFRLLLAVFVLLTTCELSVYSQIDRFYGPQSPPPKDATITFTGSLNDGQIGRVGGKLFTYTDVQLSNTTMVYWCMLENSVKLSLNDEVYVGDEILTFTPGESDLAGGVLTWRGMTTIFIASPNNAYITAYSRFRITVTEKNSGNPLSLVDPATLGLDPSIGGVLEVTDPAMIYDVRMEMFASTGISGPWEPHLDFYDSRQTIPGGGTAWSSFEYGFYWVNDAPELETLNTLDVDEGGASSITVANLKAIDAETPGDELVLTFKPNSEAAPHHGTVENGGASLGPGDTFTQQVITLGNLEYIHDGSETTKDSIPLMLTDGDGKDINLAGNSYFYLTVNVNPVDDPPILVENNEVTVEEGSSIALSSGDLLTTDAESSDAGIIYTLDPAGNSDYPENGLLKLSGVPLQDGETFSQDDISSGLVVYEHDGTGTLTDGFTFQVADEFGHPAEEAGNSIFFFQVAITPVNDDPYITSSFPLLIDEGATKVITNLLLASVDEESGPDQVIYLLDPDGIMDQPLFGTVNLDGQPLGDGQSFTQEDINQSKVTFTHDGSESLSDFFGFSVSDGEGGMASDNGFTLFQFRINVNPVNDPPFVANPIPDQSVREEQAFDYQIDQNAFGDPDPDDYIASYEFIDVDGGLGWITFDGEVGHFTGMPELGAHGEYNAVVVARDTSAAMVSDTFKITVNHPVNVDGLKSDLGYSVYPNPADENVTIRMIITEPQDVHLSLYSIDGRLVLDHNYKNLMGGVNIPVDISDLKPGVYQLRLKMRDGIITDRILKH